MEKNAYYNRVMLKELIDILKEKKYNWIIDFVKKHVELDFQTGSNENDRGEIARSWFSIYRGTSRVLILQCGKRGILTIGADKAYKELDEDFYKKETWNNSTTDDLRIQFENLLEKINKNSKKFGRYYINEKGKRKEGFYQNLISRRYSLDCKADDELIIFDKEFAIGRLKEEWVTSIGTWSEEKINKLKEILGDKSSIKASGDECDFVGINRYGDLLLLELKCADPTKTYLAPLQVGKYGELVMKYLKDYKTDMEKVVLKMIEQKKELGILNPVWKSVPKQLSGNVKMAVVVGGFASAEVKRRFKAVRDIVDDTISYYSCKEDGTLKEETL